MFKPGDKVIPLNKTAGSIGLETSKVWEACKASEQHYMFITDAMPDGTKYFCAQHEDDKGGDLFALNDLNYFNPAPKTTPSGYDARSTKGKPGTYTRSGYYDKNGDYRGASGFSPRHRSGDGYSGYNES